MGDDQKRDSSNRWWEYYFLRYFVGTVVGSMAVVFLTKLPGSHFSGLALTAIKDSSDLGIKEVTVLAALGFAYCYIASAPMLLLHATRAQLVLTPSRVKLSFCGVTSVSIVLLDFVLLKTLSIRFWSYQSTGLIAFLVIVGVQVGMMGAACWNRFEAISSFYMDLARRRAIKEDWVAQYVESYRHLREHGNAFSILLLEFAFGLTLVEAPRLRFAVLGTVLWLLPSTFSWYIGSLLESKLINSLKG
jgi:hypothetical protein